MKNWFRNKLKQLLAWAEDKPPQKDGWNVVQMSKPQLVEIPPEDLAEIEKMMGEMLVAHAPEHQHMFVSNVVPPPPAPVKRSGTNEKVLEAIEMLLTRYRSVHRIPFDVTLSHKQIAEVVSGVRRAVYQYEGRPMPKQK